MGVNEWRRELSEAERAYNNNEISKEIYESRVKSAIYEIYKCGNTADAERIAIAHGYKLKDIISEFE